MKKLGIYVHIPFCIKKCAYCDFNSYDHKAEWKEAYINALIDEISAFCADGFIVDSIFFGGGTPTVLSMVQLERILNALTKKFKIDECAEITIESNPKTVQDYQPLKAMGFNRLSIGMQSANDDELKMLGRIHTFRDFAESYEKACTAFPNINIDMMFSLPEQTIEKWMNTLETVKAFSPAHISCYSLKIEDDTPFSKMKLNLPDEESDRKMYMLAKEILTGYSRYEISNFAKEGMECRHNLKYWKRLPYAGFGAGAHSNIGDLRYANISSLEKYISAKDKINEQTTLSLEDKMSEFVFLGMRLATGVDEMAFYSQFGENIKEVFGPALDKHCKLGTIGYKNPYYSLTDYGIDVSNIVLSDFLF